MATSNKNNKSKIKPNELLYNYNKNSILQSYNYNMYICTIIKKNI